MPRKGSKREAMRRQRRLSPKGESLVPKGCAMNKSNTPNSHHADWIERTRARILHDTDPVVVAESAQRKAEWVARLGTPKRCKANEVHPATGECLYCGAANGQSCALGFGG